MVLVNLTRNFSFYIPAQAPIFLASSMSPPQSSYFPSFFDYFPYVSGSAAYMFPRDELLYHSRTKQVFSCLRPRGENPNNNLKVSLSPSSAITVTLIVTMAIIMIPLAIKHKHYRNEIKASLLYAVRGPYRVRFSPYTVPPRPFKRISSPLRDTECQYLLLCTLFTLTPLAYGTYFEPDN
jgi:hypothetical protein